MVVDDLFLPCSSLTQHSSISSPIYVVSPPEVFFFLSQNTTSSGNGMVQGVSSPAFSVMTTFITMKRVAGSVSILIVGQLPLLSLLSAHFLWLVIATSVHVLNDVKIGFINSMSTKALPYQICWHGVIGLLQDDEYLCSYLLYSLNISGSILIQNIGSVAHFFSEIHDMDFINSCLSPIFTISLNLFSISLSQSLSKSKKILFRCNFRSLKDHLFAYR